MVNYLFSYEKIESYNEIFYAIYLSYNILSQVIHLLMGASSSKSIDDNINQMIFYPPDTHNIKYIKDDTHILFNTLLQNGNSICGMIIVPTAKNIINLVSDTFGQTRHGIKFLIFSHGNASDIFTMMNYAKYLADSLNIVVVLYDYSGYGLSDGKCSEKNCYDSLVLIINYISATYNVEHKNILLMAQSLGTGVVIDYVANNDWMSPIILVSPYKSMCEIISDTSRCASLLSPLDKFESIKKIHSVKCPVKIFHGYSDNLINISHAKELFNKLNNKTLNPVWMQDTSHNDILEKIDLNEIMNVIRVM
jgi:hypothetical protein